jgi:hypothetical protein
MRVKAVWVIAWTLAAVTLTSVAVLSLASFASADPVPEVEEMVAGESASGPGLAEELGLVLEPIDRVEGCYYFSGVGEGMGYCLDEVARSDEHAYVLGRTLKGIDITEAELGSIRATLAAGAE